MKKIISILASCCLLCGTVTAQVLTNTSFGINVLSANTTGYSNAGFGNYSLSANTTGYRNTTLGNYSLGDNTTGFGNSAIGYKALETNVIGYFNTAVGGFTLTKANTSENTAIGYKSQEQSIGNQNSSLGYQSLQITKGICNVALGAKSMMSSTDGSYNTAVGYMSLANTTGKHNAAFGYNALSGVTTGYDNVGLGYRAGSNISTGIRNINIGPFSGGNYNTYSYNIAIGYCTWSTSGDNNIIIGKKITLPTGTSNAMNIGGVLYGSGFQSGLPSSPNSLPVGGKIGINVVSPTATLDVAGNVNLSTNITIGGVTAPWYKANSTDSTLRINGTIYSKEINVRTNVWADHVFSNGYQLPSLSSVEQYINTNKHLPEIPSEQEVKTNGVDLAQMNVLLLKKVEELTLHMIEQEKRIQELESKNK